MNSHRNVRTHLNFWAEVNRARVQQGATVSVDVLVNQVRVDGPDVSIPAGPSGPPRLDHMYKWMSWEDTTVQDALLWGIVLTPRSQDVTTLTVTDTPGEGANLRCPAEGRTVRLYVGPDRSVFGSAHLVEPTSVVCSDTSLTVTLTGSPAVQAGNFIEVRGTLDVDDPGASSYTNDADVVVDATPALADEVEVLRYGSSGRAEGDGAVSVGDLVWLDEDKDGRHDAGEPGIPGVTLVLTGPDGQPVTDVDGNPVGPAVTDAEGGYSFDDLPVLKDDESYTVTIDQEKSAGALRDLAPTTPGTGDRAGDSSTNSARSEGLTRDGDRDPTLDFGFVRESTPEPGPVPGPGPAPTPGPMAPGVPGIPDDEGRLPVQPGQRPGATGGARTPPGDTPTTNGLRSTAVHSGAARTSLARTGADLTVLPGVAAMLLGSGGALARSRRGRD